jgi:hypothetical protein
MNGTTTLVTVVVAIIVLLLQPTQGRCSSCGQSALDFSIFGPVAELQRHQPENLQRFWRVDHATYRSETKMEHQIGSDRANVLRIYNARAARIKQSKKTYLRLIVMPSFIDSSSLHLSILPIRRHRRSGEGNCSCCRSPGFIFNFFFRYKHAITTTTSGSNALYVTVMRIARHAGDQAQAAVKFSRVPKLVAVHHEHMGEAICNQKKTCDLRKI